MNTKDVVVVVSHPCVNFSEKNLMASRSRQSEQKQTYFFGQNLMVFTVLGVEIIIMPILSSTFFRWPDKVHGILDVLLRLKMLKRYAQTSGIHSATAAWQNVCVRKCKSSTLSPNRFAELTLSFNKTSKSRTQQ
jgi:hypothetical protein